MAKICLPLILKSFTNFIVLKFIFFRKKFHNSQYFSHLNFFLYFVMFRMRSLKWNWGKIEFFIILLPFLIIVQCSENVSSCNAERFLREKNSTKWKTWRVFIHFRMLNCRSEFEVLIFETACISYKLDSNYGLTNFYFFLGI